MFFYFYPWNRIRLNAEGGLRIPFSKYFKEVLSMRKFKKVLASILAGTLVLSNAVPVLAGQDTSSLPDGTAYLNLNTADWADFDAEWGNAEITGDGSYTVSMTAAEAVDLGAFNALEVVNGESILGTGAVLTVDSIEINGENAELQGSSYTCSADGEGVNTRVNIYNEYNDPDATATAGDDKHADCRVAEGNVADATARLLSTDDLAGVQSVEVTFTVSDFGKNAEAGEAAAGNGEFDANGEFNVYIGVQTAAYSFRNAWNDSYGLGTPEFDQITGWNGNDEVVRTGTISDAVIKGNGTYTVSLTGVDFADDAETLNLLFLSTDIPLDKGVELTDIKVKMGGKSVYDFDTAFQDPDTKDYIKALLINTYNDGFKADNEFAYTLSAGMDIEVTFTVSGLAYDNPDAAASGDTAATEATSQSTETKSEAPETTAANANAEASNGGVSVGVIIAIVAAVVVVAAIVVVAVKKKK